MSKARRKKKNNSPLVIVSAAALIALTVALAVIMVIVAAYDKSSDQSPEDSTSTSASVPATTVGGVTTPAVPHTTPSATTESKAPETTPNTPVTSAPITEQPPETTMPPQGIDYEYHIDMDEFEQYIDPTGDLWDDAYLLLVNAGNPIGKDAESGFAALKKRTLLSDCKDYTFRHKPSIYLNNTALKALSAMFLEAEAQGITTLDATSAYRDYAYQANLFNNNCNKTKHWVCKDDSCNVDWIGKSSTCPICGLTTSKTIPITREEQEANVATYSCAPGTSDHQTGLAVDIVQRSLPERFDSLIQEFGETEAGKWLAANAHYFGFVLRFPEDKEEITGIIYEPWHFRYVGRTHAMAMYEKGMCLEEYVAYLNGIGYFD